MNMTSEQAAALRMQLAAVGKSCELPGCVDQATGALKIGSVVLYLCDPHLADKTGVGVAEQHMMDAENRSRYPNGLTRSEWLTQGGQ